MIKLQDFPKHINKIDRKDWQKLFDLLPEIESTKYFAEDVIGEKTENACVRFPYIINAEIVEKTFNVIIYLEISPVYDWMKWLEGREILDNLNFNYSSLDKIDLCKLFTFIIRADRFSDGFMTAHFQNGNITKIIKALKEKVDSDQDNIS